MTSEPSNTFDAYQPPQPVEGGVAPALKKTGRAKAVCIIAIVFGCLGLFSALFGTAGLLFGEKIQDAMSVPDQPGVEQQMIRKMQKDQQAVMNRFFGVNAALLALLAVVAFGLLIGGIQCLRRVPPARKILVAACSTALVYEVLKVIRDVTMQAQMIPMSLRHTEQMMSTGSAPPAAADFAMTTARVMVVVILVFGGVWALAKLVFFGISVWYLRQPSVCDYLDGRDVAQQFENGIPT